MSSPSQMFNFGNNSNLPGQEFNFANSSGIGDGQGGNQYMNFPMMPSVTPQTSGALPAANSNGPVMPSSGGQPGLAPTAQPGYTGNPGSTTGSGGGNGPNSAGKGTGPTTTGTGTGQYQVGTPQDPALTNQLFSWLQSQVGKGVSAYPGSLTAPNNPILQQLQQLLQNGGPMGNMAKTGDPISALPEWQSMVNASQQNMQRGEANIKEQMNVGGNLSGSPFGDSLQKYMSQTVGDQNAQLVAAQTQALEQAQGRKLQATEFESQFKDQFGQYMQGLDQQSIDRMYQEYIRTSPAYNPLLSNEQQAAGQYPPYLHTKDSMDQFAEGVQAGGSLFKDLFSPMKVSGT